MRISTMFNGASISLTPGVAALLLMLCLLAALENAAYGQEGDDESHQEWVHSMGQPLKVLPYGGLSAGTFGSDKDFAGYGSFGIYKDIVNPALSAVGFSLEGYVGGRTQELDGGFRALIGSRVLRIGGGIDYNLREKNWNAIFYFSHPLRRGGLFGRGSEFRVDWIPSRGNALNFGFTMPLFQPHVGTTRPPKDHVNLKRHKLSDAPHEATDPSLNEALANIRRTAQSINRLTTPFLDQRAFTSSGAIDAFERRINALKSPLSDGRTLEDLIRDYHQELEQAFSIAAANEPTSSGMSTAHGREIASEAKHILLDSVILPYNRLLGQKKKKDTTLAFSPAAQAAFDSWAEVNIPAKQVGSATHVFRELLGVVEEARRFSRKDWGNAHEVWIPLQLALLPEEHDTQEEIDVLIERAAEERFHDGNQIYYVVNEQFQKEVNRTVHMAEDYHILWIHDVRAVNFAGEPDSVTYLQIVNGYLDAMTQRVKAYDETGKLPLYMIFQDQFFYELNKSRRVHNLLENPLGYEIPSFPEGFEHMGEVLSKAQFELRSEVAVSRRLQEKKQRYGEDWLRNRIKVHVSITNPADVSFFSWSGLPIVGTSDTVIRDHRKICFYDITEEDPYKGMALYSGMGLGEHYVGATWEDRGILVKGPATLALKDRARELLLNQGWRKDQIPLPLRVKAKPENYEEMVRVGSAKVEPRPARGIDLHNRNAFGPKSLSVAKAALYNLIPRGSTVVVPDHLWTGRLWGSLLLGASLRGVRVFVISPSVESHPAGRNPIIQARIYDLMARLITAQNVLREEIESAGGMLRTGIYDIDLDVKDIPGRVKMALDTINKNPFLQDLFNADPATFAITQRIDEVLEEFNWKQLVPQREYRKPKIHLKLNFLASKEAWAVLEHPELAEYLADYAREWAQQVADPFVYTDIAELPKNVAEKVEKLRLAHEKALTPEQRKKTVSYLTVGSQNQDERAFFLDGEVGFLVSGGASGHALADVLLLMGNSHWVDSLEKLEAFIPEQSNVWRWLGWFGRWAI